jgi:nitrogen fixation NifU-like protein
MTSDIDALYADVIVDHNKRPRHFRRLESGRSADGVNPLCGDRLTIYVRVEEGVIREATFQGFGCAIAKASASLMTESVTEKTVADADALSERVERMVTAPAGAPIDDLGALSALAGVRRFPARVKCATLPWQTLRAAVTAHAEPVSTE